MSKEVLNKKAKLTPVPTDKPLSTRLGRAFIGFLATFIVIGALIILCMKTLESFDIVVGFEPLLFVMNVASALVVGIIVFIFESEGNYKRDEQGTRKRD